MSLASVPLITEGRAANFCVSKYSGTNWIVFASGTHVLVFNEQLELQLMLDTQCRGANITAVALNEYNGFIAVGYQQTVELLHPETDFEGNIRWSHAVSLSQNFLVNSLVWKGTEHLFVLGKVLAIWECVASESPMRDVSCTSSNEIYPNSFSLGVWICTFAHSLPVPVNYATLSPDQAFLATLSSDPEDKIVRIFRVSFAAECTPLKQELGRVLGRSFSQNLDSFGSSTALEYIPLLLDGVPCKLAWRPNQHKTNAQLNTALIISTHDGLQYLFVENPKISFDSCDRLEVCFVTKSFEEGEIAWWLDDHSLGSIVGHQMQIIGEGCASLLIFTPRFDISIARINSIDLATTSTFSIDHLINVSCTWDSKLPELGPQSCVLIKDQIAVWINYVSSELSVARLLPTTPPFDSRGDPTDFNYEILSKAIPSLATPDHLCLSEIGPFGCAISTSAILVFKFESGITQRVYALPQLEHVFPSHYSDVIYAIDLKGRLFVLSSSGYHEAKGLQPLERLIGEFVDESGSSLLVARHGPELQLYSHDNSNFCLLKSFQCPHFFPGPRADFCVLGDGKKHSWILAQENSSMQMLSWPDSNYEKAALAFVKISNTGGKFNRDGDFAFLSREKLPSHPVLNVCSLCPSSPELFKVTEVEFLPEEPLGLTWSFNRDIYLALTDCVTKYSPILDEHGTERWRRRGASPWPTTLPHSINPTSFSIAVAHDSGIWIIVDGIVFQLPPIIDDDLIEGRSNADVSRVTIPERIAAFRSINCALLDRFDLLEVPEPAEKQHQMPDRKTKCHQQEFFSFFDDISLLNLTRDDDSSAKVESDMVGLDNGSDSSLKAPLRTPLLSLSQISHDTAKVSSIRRATLEATLLLKENEAAVDAAGAKYLFFAKLSWEAGEDIRTHGFEYLAASLSDAQEILIAKNLELLGNNASWCKFTHLGMGFWVRSELRLRELLEDIARTDFMIHRDPASCAVLYLVLGRRSFLKSLWKAAGVADAEGSRMVAFLESNFEDEQIRSVAAKNAFAALAKQRVLLAIIFFILSNRLDDALQVCFERLEDYHLGFLIGRFLCDDAGRKRMLNKHIRGNRQLPICIRGLMKKFFEPEADMLELIKEEAQIEPDWLDHPGMCLPLAVVSLKKRRLPPELVLPCIRQLCLSGCFELAGWITTSYNGQVKPELSFFIETYRRRWS